MVQERIELDTLVDMPTGEKEFTEGGSETVDGDQVVVDGRVIDDGTVRFPDSHPLIMRCPVFDRGNFDSLFKVTPTMAGEGFGMSVNTRYG